MLRHPSASGLMEGGFVFYGGLITGPLGYLLGCKIARCHPRDFTNIFAFVIPFIHAFGRIGCFCAGCCYGIPYSGPFALHYKAPVSDAPLNTGLFPVQLTEALLLFIFAFVILWLLFTKIRAADHPLFAYYMIYYSVVRFMLEFLRYDSARGFIWIFSISQWISMILFIVGLAIITIKILHKDRQVK